MIVSPESLHAAGSVFLHRCKLTLLKAEMSLSASSMTSFLLISIWSFGLHLKEAFVLLDATYFSVCRPRGHSFARCRRQCDHSLPRLGFHDHPTKHKEFKINIAATRPQLRDAFRERQNAARGILLIRFL